MYSVYLRLMCGVRCRAVYTTDPLPRDFTAFRVPSFIDLIQRRYC